MAPVEMPMAPRERLVTALRETLASNPETDPVDAERLACVLVAREQLAATVGARPGGPLEALPAPFGRLVIPERALEALDTVRQPVDPAAIGSGYGAALPGEARGDRGQFFTPRAVADALVQWALGSVDPDDGPPRVLDPAVGTGSFLLSAFVALRERHGNAEPATLLGRLTGIDVDGLALHLAGLRLAAAANVAAPTAIALHQASFFDYAPRRAGAANELPPVDVVVGNPPFVRAEALQPDADHYRDHLATFGPPGETPLLDGPDALSRRSDAYVYFVTHATRFLRPGGRLALVLPTKWLMSDYGTGLRRFFRERYRVHAVVGFGGRAFGDALVDTALLLAERDENEAADQPVRFVRVAGPDALRTAVSADQAPTGATEVTERPQTVLTSSGSLARYLEVPDELLALFRSGPFVRLDALAEVARGTMTGANRFFFVDDDVVDRFDLEVRFLHPAVKSLRSVDRPVVADTDIDRYLVDVHAYVASARDAHDDGGDPTGAIKRALAADGHTGLLGYVEHAEAAGWQTGRTCQSRPVWFDLGSLRAPAAFVPKLLRERLFAIRNEAGAVSSNAIDGIWPADGVDPTALHAVLCSSVGQVAMEATGRDEAGLLQLMTYETASLPILDVRACPATDRQAIARAGVTYAQRPGRETLAALDEAVDAAFELPLSPAAVRDHATALRRRRVDDAVPAAQLAD